MKFRPYQLLFVLSLALLIATMVMPIVNIIEPNGATAIVDNFAYTAADGAISHSVVALGVILIVAALVNLFALFVSMFSNFALQKRSAILAMLLLTGYYILLLVYLLVLTEGAAVAMLPAMFLPLTTIASNAVAFTLVRKQEAKIIAKALGFRLRD